MANLLNILIPDGESTFALLLLPCFSQIENATIHVLSTKNKNPIKHSRYVESYQLVKSKENWLNQIHAIIIEKAIDVIVPIAEDEVRFFIQHQKDIKEAKIMWLPSLKSFDIATNKLKLNLFCVEHKVIVPKSYVIKLSNNSTFNFNNINYPVLIKPLRSEGGGGIVRLDSQLLLVKFIKDSLKEDLFIQEYVTGYDIDCSVFCLNGKILAYTIQQGNLQASTPYKQQLGVSFLDNDEVLLEVTTLMKALDWSGIAHLDLRYDQKANNYKVIEINARFWGSLLASLNVGVNFPKLLIEQTLGKPIIFQNYRKESYLQLKGLFKLLKQNPLMLFKLKFISTNTDLKYIFKDPLPTFYKIFYWFQRKFD